MQRLQPAEIAAFLKRFRFRDARLVSIRTRFSRGLDPAVEVRIVARTNPRKLADPKPVRLKIRLNRVDEFRLQKRLGSDRTVLNGVEIGYFNSLFFLNLDPWDLGDELPALHDFRAAEAYFAGAELLWEIAEKPGKEPPR